MKKFAKTSRGRSSFSLFVFALSVLSFSCHSPAAPDDSSVIPIYEDDYASGVSDWSWTTTNALATEQVFEGNHSLYGELNGWEGIYLGITPSISVPADGYLQFAIYSESSTEIVVHTSSVDVGDGIPIVILSLIHI